MICRWYRKGESNPLEAVTKLGGSRNVATLSTLVLQPQKEDDGAEYRCVAWNRALDANDKKETTVALTVNCKSLSSVSLLIQSVTETAKMNKKN